jgi:alginate O-acetyltransferase complex protein AlgI
MLFDTPQFWLFFLAVFLTYWALPWAKARVWLLLAASFTFYATWNHWLACLIFVTTTLDYVVARSLDASTAPRWRRLLLLASLVVNVGMLVYFKYANFFLRSLEDALAASGARVSLPVLQVILPIGISFYTFEAINYTVDVYHRKIPAERDFAHFVLFILFFPHLVAGPIVRARDFLPQVRRRKRWSWGRFHLGLRFVLLGLFKKLAVADHMALYADPVFADPAAYGTAALWLAAVAYAIQVYCDFCGYSDIALGTAHMLGYKLAPNFDLPYLAANIADFWRRWHISLSSWMRDYLFIPMGGSRGSRWQTCRNLLVTMTLGGLWHGANWPFVVFGVIQGCYLSTHRAFRSWCGRRPRLDAALQTAAGTALRVAFTFACFICSLVIFRAATLHLGTTMLRRMFGPHDGLPLPPHAGPVLQVFVLGAVVQLLARYGVWKKLGERLPAPARGLGFASLLLLTLLLAPVTSKTFIYFQF